MAHHQRLHHKLAKRHLVPRDPQPQVLSVVYVTITPTFTGDIGGFSTLTDDDTTTTTQASIILGTPAQQSASATSTELSASASEGFDFNTITTSSATSITSPSSTIASSREKSTTSAASTRTSTFVSSTSEATTSSSVVAVTTLLTSATVFSQTNTHSAVVAASAAVSSQASTGSTQSGLSPGAKAGIAIGFILLIAAVAIGALVFSWKRKKQNRDYQKADDEKTPFGQAAARPVMTSNSQSNGGLAPRLSLRPMSRLLPDLVGGTKKRTSQGNPLSTFNQTSPVAGTGRSLTPSPRSGSPWERRADENPASAGNPFSDPQNPFADSEKSAPPPNVLAPSISDPSVAAGIAGTVAGASLAAMAASAANSSPKPPSPVLTPLPAAAPLASNSPPSNVYRVMMDFKPSMDDELELRSGQLVRMIHEYDDGWALCIRLDRSQQGVAPRTCLAANPSKPRPANGPRGPPVNGRVSPANGRMNPAMSRPMSPAHQGPRVQQSRSASPAINGSGPVPASGSRADSPSQQVRRTSQSTGAYNQAPRPLSPGPRPAPKRSMSPGPYGPGGAQKPIIPAARKQRSNSAGALNVRDRREMGPGPSRLGPGSGAQRSAGPGLAI